MQTQSIMNRCNDLFDDMPLAIMTSNFDGKYLYLNPVLRKKLALSDENISSISDLLSIIIPDKRYYAQIMDQWKRGLLQLSDQPESTFKLFCTLKRVLETEIYFTRHENYVLMTVYNISDLTTGELPEE